MLYNYEEYIQIFKALSDETRLKIISMLSSDELCACKILEEFNITQPTLSYHMKILTESGLVSARKDGSWMRYSINSHKKTALIEFIGLIGANGSCCCGGTECR
jgi:ArsR family transcriptional regulator, arsenate/arsenite/antimonite-responsive transcriptional repressor